MRQKKQASKAAFYTRLAYTVHSAEYVRGLQIKWQFGKLEELSNSVSKYHGTRTDSRVHDFDISYHIHSVTKARMKFLNHKQCNFITFVRTDRF